MTTEVINGEIFGMAEDEVTYPLLVSLFADTKMGKTFYAASHPNAVVIDFPPVHQSFGVCEFDPIAITRTVGEGFRSLFIPVRKPDKTLVYKPKIDGFDYKNQYHFPKSWEEFQTALEKAKYYAEDIATIPDAGKVWVVLDDSYRWRGMEIMNYCRVNKRKWPSQPEFGKITQTMASQLTAIRNFANVIVVHRTTKDFESGLKVPLVYPTSCDFDADLSISLCHEQRNGSLHQVAKIFSTGHDFPCQNPDYQIEVLDPTPVDVLAAAKIPRPLW